MSSVSIPRVLFCGPEDPFFRRLSRHAEGFQLEARKIALGFSPQKLARTRRAAALILPVRGEFSEAQSTWLSRNNASVPVFVLCQNGTLETAARALQYRIFDYFCTTQDPALVADRIREAVSQKSKRSWKPAPTRPGGPLHGGSTQIQKLNHEARNLALESGKPVILYGEPGTGKEHLAFGMYRMSFPRSQPFIRYDCRLIHQIAHYDGLPASRFILTGLQELRKRHGGGVLFLQHLEQLQPDQRSDVLEAARGSTIRLIASSLELPESAAGIPAVVPALRIPALRLHAEDVPALAEHFILRTSARRRIPPKSVSPDILSVMQEYSWPGNVQELANVIDRMMVLEPSRVLSSHSWRISNGYPFHWKLEGGNHFATLLERFLLNSDGTWDDGATYEQFMRRMKRMLIDLVLPRVDHNQATAARVLGISRNTLREILRQS